MSSLVESLEVRVGFSLTMPKELTCSRRHRRVVNWAAKTFVDPTSPEGVGRNFLRRGNGPFKFEVAGLAVGDFIEMASDEKSEIDNYTFRRSRTLGRVVAVSASDIQYEVIDTYSQFIKAMLDVQEGRVE